MDVAESCEELGFVHFVEPDELVAIPDSATEKAEESGDGEVSSSEEECEF